MKVYVLVQFLTPFDNRSPASEQVSVLGVYRTHEAAEAAWQKWRVMFDTPHDDYEIVTCGLDD